MKRFLILAILLSLTVLPALSEEEEAQPVTISFTCVGDCTLGGVANHTASSEKMFARAVDKNGYEWFLEKVRYLFEADDFTLINLEGPLTTATEYEEKASFYFRGRPSDVQILTCSSVEVATLANNHSHNFRQAGYDETVKTLEEAGVGVCGYEQVYYASCKGVTVGFAGFDQWLSDDEQIRRVLTEARKNCDLLIVSYHGGIENSYGVSEAVRHAGRLSIDLGADLVVGNHSHVFSGIELYKGKYIIGSLGNFLFGGNTNPKDLTSTIFRQSFTVYPDGRIEDAGIDIIPASVSSVKGSNNCQPCVMENEHYALKHFNSVMRLSSFKAKDIKWLEDSFAVSHGLDK
ncbi:MAG: CapA family protein [Clostridia bacterium]|nr:CapA family protein [Clostridia bacterium]